MPVAWTGTRMLVTRSAEHVNRRDSTFHSRSAVKVNIFSRRAHQSIGDVDNKTAFSLTTTNTRWRGDERSVSGTRNSSAPTKTSLMQKRCSIPASPRTAKSHIGTSEAPRKPSFDFPQIGSSDVTHAFQSHLSSHQHRHLKMAANDETQAVVAKTLTPSKYGFHPRSHSPTFQRLVAVADKLQIVSGACDSSSGCLLPHHRGRCHDSGATVVRLPDVTVWSRDSAEATCCDVDDAQSMKDDKNVKGIETISDLTNVHLSSIKRPDHKHISDDEKLTACSLGPPSGSCHGESEGERSQGLHSPNGLSEECLDREAKQQREETFADSDEYRLKKREDPSPMTVWVSPSADLTTRDASVQHIFPRLTETRVPVKKTVTFSTVSTSHEAPASVEQTALPPGMMAQSKTMPPLHFSKRLRVPDSPGCPEHHFAGRSTARQSHTTAHWSHRHGQLPQNGHQGAAAERNAKFHRGARFDSPKGATKKRLHTSSLSGEPVEPFLKGELLKERLEDVQTLISQDHE